MKLRVGLVGLGDQWENRHRPALRALADRFEVRAVCGEVGLLASQAAAEFQATPVDGFRALADRKDVDAVLMLAPQWFGPLPILAACDYGKAVYCVNAVDIPSEKAEVIRTRIQQAGIAFMLEFPRRHAPATLRLKELIATKLGAPRILFCHQRLSRISLQANGGSRQRDFVLKNLVEMVDLCTYIIGRDPTSTVGMVHAPPREDGPNDYEMMSLDYSKGGAVGSGPSAQLSCGRYITDQWPEAVTFRPPAALQVCCENGIAFLDLPASLVWFDEAGRHMESLHSERPVGEQLLSQFYREVTSLVRDISSLEDSYRALRIVLSARKSTTEGRRIEL